MGVKSDAIIETPCAPPCLSCKSSATNRSSAYARDCLLISPFLPAASAHASVPLLSRTPTCSENADKTHIATFSPSAPPVSSVPFAPQRRAPSPFPRASRRNAARSRSAAARHALRAFAAWIPKSLQNFSSKEFSRAISQRRAISSGSERTSPTYSSLAASANALSSGSFILPQSESAAMRETVRKHPRRVPSMSILAYLGWTGKAAILRPSGVIFPLLSRAPRFESVRKARAYESSGGASNSPMPPASIPAAASHNTIWLKSRRDISEGVYFSKAASSDALQSLTTFPGAVRPALPAR